MYDRWLHLSDEQRIQRYERLTRLRDASLRATLKNMKIQMADGKVHDVPIYQKNNFGRLD